MSTADLSKPPEAITYPDCDGQPMSDNTAQFDYIKLITNGLETLYADLPNVCVFGNLLWYPVERNNDLRRAPDAMVVFGRPKGYRGSYRQWEEDGIAPQVVFEILSPGNRRGKLAEGFAFYQRYGVEEYYVYDPERGTLQGYQRQAEELVAILFMHDWVSPRLQVRFRLLEGELALYRPDGSRFATAAEEYAQKKQERAAKEAALQKAQEETRRAEQERAAKEQALRTAQEQEQQAERERAEKEQERAAKELALREAEGQKRRAEEQQRRAEEQQRRADAQAEQLARLQARLKELGLDPDA